jgi:hypothetical protein
MADVLACNYRYITQDKDGKPLRVVLKPGAKTENLPQDVQADLKKRRLIVDEKRLTEDGVRLPYGHPDREDAVAEPEPVTEPVTVQSKVNKDDDSSKTSDSKK